MCFILTYIEKKGKTAKRKAFNSNDNLSSFSAPTAKWINVSAKRTNKQIGL